MTVAADEPVLPQGTADLFASPENLEKAIRSASLELSSGSECFTQQHMCFSGQALDETECSFSDVDMPEEPDTLQAYANRLLSELVSHSTRTSDPRFIGHMTSALPAFMLPLSKLMTALNQNVVKVETSGSFTPMERQVLAMLHKLAFHEDDEFYHRWVQSDEGALGAFSSGGTVANITALWTARNLAFKSDEHFKGVHQEGLAAALRYFDYTSAAVVVSERGHYSLAKAMDILGLGRQSLVTIPVDGDHRVRIDLLRQTCNELQQSGVRIIAIVGIAGTTETGSVDNLSELADVAEQFQTYFHVDAAWGGASLMSERGSALMHGIDRADSITIDAHKQMYVPMGAGMVLFRNPETVKSIEHHANYILRRGSKDLGRHTLEGSRPGIAMLVHACLHVIGRKGYAALIDRSLDRAGYFAKIIEQHPDFQLVCKPQLCILTYRYVPSQVQSVIMNAPSEQLENINHCLNELTADMQVAQREAGISFVSRTQLRLENQNNLTAIVFRVVLANPLTSNEILHEILTEQVSIAQSLSARMDALWLAAFPVPQSKAG